MIPFNINRTYSNNSQLLVQYADKMNKNQLTIEDILKEEDLVNDMKKNSSSQFYSIFSNEIIRKLIDYSTKMPESTDMNRGFKFPYFSCEILSSDSGTVMDLFLYSINLQIEESDEDGDSNESEEDDEEEEEDEDKMKNEDEELLLKEEIGLMLDNKEDIMKDDSEPLEEKAQYESLEKEIIAIKDAVEVKPEAELKPEEEIKQEVEIKTEAEIKPEGEIKPEREIKQEAEIKTEAEIKPEAELKNEEEIITEKDQLTETNIKQEIIPQPETVTETKEIKENQTTEAIENKTESESEVPQEETKASEETQPIEEEKTEPQKEDKEEEVDNYTYSDDEETKQRKKDKASKLRQKKKYKIVYENLDYFFNFLKIESQENNYVLIGYFHKIFINLLEKKGDIVICYLFDYRSDFLRDFIRHLNRRLIGDCVSRILTYVDNKNQTLNEKKIEFLTMIIQTLHETKDEDYYEYICYTLMTSITNKQFFPLLMSNSSLVDLLFSALHKDMNNEHIIQSLLLLMIKINELLLKSFNGLVTPERTPPEMEQMNMNFFEQMNNEDDKKGFCLLGETEEENETNLQLGLQNLFKTLKENNFMIFENLDKYDKSPIEETTYGPQQNRLGMKKLIQAEYFRTLMDLFLNAYVKNYFKEDVELLFNLAIETKVLHNLIDLLFMFEFNNMYQTIFGQILSVILNEHTPKVLIDYFFINEKLIERMQDHLLNKRILSFSTENITNAPLFAFEVNFINELSNTANNDLRVLIQENKEMNIFFKIFTNDLVNLFRGKLCYSEEGNTYANYQFNAQPTQSHEKTMEFSLNELINNNTFIYDAYSKGEEYEALLEEKLKREESWKAKNEIQNQNNLSVDDNNVFDKKMDDNENENDEKYDYDNNEDNLNDYEERKIEEIKEKEEFYDPNYWNIPIPGDDNLLNDLE